MFARRGYSVVDLIVVLAMVAILIAMLAPAQNKIHEAANPSSRARNSSLSTEARISNLLPPSRSS